MLVRPGPAILVERVRHRQARRRKERRVVDEVGERRAARVAHRPALSASAAESRSSFARAAETVRRKPGRLIRNGRLIGGSCVRPATTTSGGQVRTELARVEAVGAVERQPRVSPPGGLPGATGGIELGARSPRRVPVRIDDGRKRIRALRLGPHGEERRADMVLPRPVCETHRPLAQVDLALGKRRRSLLHHDCVPVAGVECCDCGARRPSGPRGSPHPARSCGTRSRCDRILGERRHHRREVIRRRETVADEEDAQRCRAVTPLGLGAPPTASSTDSTRRSVRLRIRARIFGAT